MYVLVDCPENIFIFDLYYSCRLQFVLPVICLQEILNKMNYKIKR